MSRKILLNVSSHVSRAAIIENDKLTELFYELPESEKIVGCIFKGRVANIVPGTQSAFVDIGIHKDAYLTANGVEEESGDTVPDIFKSPIQNVLKVGQEVVLQILKEPTLTKGPRSTMTISMPGRYLVYMPKVEHICVSRRIQSDKERDRLRSIGKKILPKGSGVVFRTASEGLEENILRSDLELLIKMWQKIEQKLKSSPPKTMLHRDIPLPMKIVRDFFTDEVEEFIVDSQEAYNSILEDCDFLTPMQRASLELYNGDTPLFEKYNIEKEIERALARKIWLNSGGYVFFDKTEAMHCIDVNSGRFSGGHDLEETVFKLNLEAAKEIARQIRLRNLSGVIIIDFIDMEARTHRAQVLKTFKECFKGDRNKPKILDFSEFGLIQMTRRRTSASLDEVLKQACPCCHGSGRVLSITTIINRIKIRVENEAKRYQTNTIAVAAHEKVIEALRQRKLKDIEELENQLQIKIVLKTSNTSLIEEFLAEPIIGDVKMVKNEASESMPQSQKQTKNEVKNEVKAEAKSNCKNGCNPDNTAMSPKTSLNFDITEEGQEKNKKSKLNSQDKKKFGRCKGYKHNKKPSFKKQGGRAGPHLRHMRETSST